MIGRYFLPSPEPPREFAGMALDFDSNFNVAPGHQAPILILQASHEFAWIYAHWGLIPSWSPNKEFALKMINARAETINEKRAYTQAYRKRRALVPAGGFYVWNGATEQRQPYVICLKDGTPMAMAGIWETWQDDEQEITSFSIVSTPAVPRLADYTQRMPVILPSSRHEEWLLTDTSASRLGFMLLPYGHEEQLRIYPVSTHVNNPAHRDAKCIEPIILDGGHLRDDYTG